MIKAKKVLSILGNSIFKNKEKMNKFERIVHLDLKGAPLKVPYLEQVMRMSKSWGATGILLEWEDTFPYSDDIADIGSEKDSSGDGLYSMAEVQHIFKFAKDHGLVAIQLVQTIGHLEFVLKHPAYLGLREIPSSPAVICPTRAGSQELIIKMVDQALNAQPDALYFHIGADEVWFKNECVECRIRSTNKRFRGDSLYLDHIQNISSYIKRKRPDLTILMWDDMLRPLHEDALRTFDLTNIQPVYWKYHTLETFQTDFVLWKKYTKVFPKIWAGSAFKGANGSCQVLSPVDRYVSNHEAWLREIHLYNESIQFVGIILTGWSRYDHYATLCELMPVMLPSLASCLRLMTTWGTVPRDQLVGEVLSPHEWPGESLARCVHQFVALRERCRALLSGDQVATWLNPWQIEKGFTVCIHVESIAYAARILQAEVQGLHDQMSLQLNCITGKRSADEWLKSNLTPLLTEMTALYNHADSAMSRDAAIKA